LCLNKTYPLPCCTVKMHEVEVVITREQSSSSSSRDRGGNYTTTGTVV
jgi:hypothetical protein